MEARFLVIGARDGASKEIEFSFWFVPYGSPCIVSIHLLHSRHDEMLDARRDIREELGCLRVEENEARHRQR